MKRALYRDGIAWIALNDEPNEFEVDSIRVYISVCLLAELFQVETMKVAQDVMRYRLKERR